MSTLQSAAALPDEEQTTQTNQEQGQIGSDLSRFDNSEAVRSVRRMEAGAVAGSRRRTKPRVRPSLVTVLCCVVAIAFAGMNVRSQLDLTVINDEIAKLEEQYVALRNENVRLQTDYESRYDLGEVEQYAVKSLGMIKLERTQVEYVEIASPDSIRSVNAGDNADGSYIGTALKEAFRSFVALLRGLEN